MLGRLLLTVDAIGMCVGTLKADFFNESHMYNPHWPPHAKFHNVQTITLAVILSFITLYYTWRPAQTLELHREFMFTSSITGSIYWLAGLISILPSGTMGLDPEFGGPGFPQRYFFITLMSFGLLGAWLEY
ncbi:hypothetical protein F4806DRAFT_244712 [Annulohypoxylon nitens]|nr:hypothetical protein F4806DRAFT_244712 [Annulohypoxylon nitens]